MPEIVRRHTENPTHMPEPWALVHETSRLRNLGNGQAAVQQGSPKFDPALNNELMERDTYRASKQRPGV